MVNGILAQPLTQTAIGGVEQGQGLAQAGVRRNALSQIAGAINTGDLTAAGQGAAQIGDVDLAIQIRGLVKEGRTEELAKVKQAAFDLQDIVARFDTVPPEQLPQAVQASLPLLSQMFPDIPSEQIMQNALDPNARRAAVAQAQNLVQLLDREERVEKLELEREKAGGVAARGRETLDIARGRLNETQRANLVREDAALQKEQAKVDLREQQAASAQEKAAIKAQGNIGQIGSTRGVVTRLIEHPGLKAAVGVSLQKTPFFVVPGSDRADFLAIVETLQARLGFEELARMRAASPTGGALGQISERELSFLQAAVQSLDPSQTEKQFIENLNLILASLDRFEAAQRQFLVEGGQAGEGDLPPGFVLDQ